jgi:RsiW-degrading membrane proteinase PrsW (M82 family)
VIIGLVLAGICALVSLSFDLFDGGGVHFFIALVLALAPVPLLLAGVLALDRMEPEPRGNLIFAFAWGAGVAVLVAGVLNSLNLMYVSRQIIDHEAARNLVATFGAPPVEETMKGLVLLGLLRWRRQELDGPTDGIIYASMVGLGFGMSENVSYYVIAVAYAAQRRKGRAGLIIMGWIGAMLLHGLWNGLVSYGGFLWNGFASYGGFAGLAVAYLILMVLFFVELGVIVRDRKRIVGLIQRYLPQYQATGLVNETDIFMLSSLQGRRQARQWAKANGRRDGLVAMRDYQLAATELGLLHERAARGVIDERDFAEQQRALLYCMGVTRARFPLPERHHAALSRGLPPPGYAPGAPPSPPHDGPFPPPGAPYPPPGGQWPPPGQTPPPPGPGSRGPYA